MHDTTCMRRVQSGGRLPEDRKCLGDAEASLTLEQRRERFPLEELHGEEVEWHAFDQRRMQVEDPANVGVRDAPGEQDLAPEPIEARRVDGEGRQEGLQRDAGPERGVVRFEHLAHSAARDEPDDDEPAGDGLAWLKTSAPSADGDGLLQGWLGARRRGGGLLRGLPRPVATWLLWSIRPLVWHGTTAKPIRDVSKSSGPGLAYRGPLVRGAGGCSSCTSRSAPYTTPSASVRARLSTDTVRLFRRSNP